MELPDRQYEVGEEDIQDIEDNISKLADKYLTPIDGIRSIENPNETSNTGWVESRAHAFLRYVGFPVVAGPANPNDFYNPGYAPPTQYIVTGINKKEGIISKYNSSNAFKTMVDEREIDPREAKNIFVRQDTSSSVYSLLLTHVRNFKLFEASGAFSVKELQSFDIDSRQDEANKFFANNKNVDQGQVLSVFTQLSIVGANYTGGRHILHPFVVDPVIDDSVQPDSSLIAAPFLQTKEDLKMGSDEFISRPGLELIIRERLRDHSNEAKLFYESIKKVIENDSGPSSDDPTILDENSLRLTVEALLDDNKITQSAIDSDIKGITNVQVKNIVNLVKVLKKVIDRLHEAVKTIHEVRDPVNGIDWSPVISADGPEQGPRNAIAGQKILRISNVSELDRRILELDIKKSDFKRKITEELKIGDFASPFNSSVNDGSIDNITERLDELIQKRNAIAYRGYVAMGDIEKISGEVSGLGLIDVLAVYIALWSIDEMGLISLLDDNSFARMSIFFDDLIVGAAADRRDNGNKDNIVDALDKFEKKLVNVFSFVDREVGRKLVAPGEEYGGTISAES